jgi:hypothetical protein
MDDEQPETARSNSAFRTYQLSASAVFSADWSTVRALWASDAFRDDRRSMGGPYIQGIDALIGSAQEWVDLGFVISDVELVAERGDRLAVARQRIRTRDDYLIEFLALTELDERGLIDRLVYFEIDDLSAAHAELDLRLSELESAS